MKAANDTARHHRDMAQSHRQSAESSEVIGKTQSGKDIHIGGAGHPDHGKFTAHDHLDAAIRHREMEQHHRGVGKQAQGLEATVSAAHRAGWSKQVKFHDRQAHNHSKNAQDHLNTVKHMVSGTGGET